jgi:hypothetical protein
MPRQILLLSWCFLLAAASCAPQPTIIKLLPDDFSRVRNDGVIHAIHIEHDALFVSDPRMTTVPGIIVFGLLGEKEGRRIASENGLQDPVYLVRSRFLDGLASNHGVTNVKVVEQPRKDADQKIEKLRADFKDGTVLEFKTDGSAIVWITKVWNYDWKYSYTAELRLIRLSDGKTLWQQQCKAEGKPLEKKDMFTADGAKVLKADMPAAAEECARQLLAKFPP